MEFSQEEIEEFKNEALELLDEAEHHLLALEKGGDFKKTYDAVFRVFHSIKGGAGMLGLDALQAHMHQLESHYQQCKVLSTLSKETISYFLKGADGSRQILGGAKISFTYNLPENLPNAQPHTSQPDAQTTPSVPTVEKTTSSSTSTIEEMQEGLGKIKVMIIDDEADIVSTLKDLLEDSGFDSVGFTSPQDALNQLNTEKPDVILTDIKMDTLTGFDILKLARKQNPDLPVIFVSGFISKELIVEALSYGVFAAIEKPFFEPRIIELCTNAGQKHQLTKLLNNLINFVYYQYCDLEQYLKSKGDKIAFEMMQEEFRALIEAKRKLKLLNKTEPQSFPKK